MRKLIEKIRELEKISGELEPSEPARDEYLKLVNDYAGRFINNIESAKTFSGIKPEPEILPIDGRKRPMEKLLRDYEKQVTENGINAASGGHLGYIPGGGVYTSALADYLAAVTNEYAGLFYASPGAVIMENEVLKWLKTIFGFPQNSAGSLTSGGSVANLIALTAARDHHKIKSDRIAKSVVYLSVQTHHCIHKSLKIIGLEDILIRYTALDQNYRINAASLEKQINKDKSDGLNPFLIIATAGTTDTGAVDPLADIGRIARIYKLWYHIDAAYGGFFILTGQKKELFRGIDMADSLVTDPHKGLFVPYGTGAVLVRNKEAVLKSHKYTANYMQDSTRSNEDYYEPADLSPELTRHFRALRIWLPLQIHGLKPFIACLEEKLLLLTYFRNRLSEIGFKMGPEPDLSVSYFWYPTEKTDEDLFNRRLLELIHREGSIFFSSTTIESKFVIRVAVLSFRTRLRTIDKAIEILNNARMSLEEQL